MKCEKCGKKIQYNQYRILRGLKPIILCLDCYKKPIEENTARIKALREARKIKRSRRKKVQKKKEPEDKAAEYNPFKGE